MKPNQKSKWEKEFEERFTLKHEVHKGLVGDEEWWQPKPPLPKEVKSFISKLIKKERKKVYHLGAIDGEDAMAENYKKYIIPKLIKQERKKLIEEIKKVKVNKVYIMNSDSVKFEIIRQLKSKIT